MSNNNQQGYLALPSSENKQAVLVLHAWWGLNETLKAICERLAAAGYTAYAPDLYHGKIAKTIPEAEALGAELESRGEEAIADVNAAVDYLLQTSNQSDQKLVIIAFSLGAFFAVNQCSEFPEKVKGVVLFYGAGPEVSENCQASFLGHFAENDQYEPRKYIDALEESIKRAGCEVTFYSYSGVGHWFFEPDRKENYNESAANLAWERTLEFLNKLS